MNLILRKLDPRSIERMQQRADPRISKFLTDMLALENPFHGMQMNVGLRRIGIGKVGREIRPKFVSFEEGRKMLKGDAKAVVALGNGGHSQTADPNEWFTGSVIGKVNGSMPFVFNSPNIKPEGQLIYAAPVLVVGRGNGRVDVFEAEITGSASLRDVTRALHAASRTPRTYGLLSLGNDTKGVSTSIYQATATYSYTTKYTSDKCSGIHPQSFEVKGEPLTVLLSANTQDTHSIRATGENVHALDMYLPEGVITRGLVLNLA